MPIIIDAPGDGQYVVSFADATPSARFDGVPWNTVEVVEAATKGGTAVLTVSGALSPLDTDPANPQSRDITVKNATLAAGWYQLTFLDADGNRQPTRWVYNGGNISPSMEDIAALLRTRLVDTGGNPLATFTDTSTPTRQQVETFITSAIRRVRLKVGAVQEDLADDAREVVALYAAARAELTLWPEQVPGQQSPYRELIALADAALTDLDAEVEEVAAGGEPGPADDVVRPIGLLTAAATNWGSEPL